MPYMQAILQVSRSQQSSMRVLITCFKAIAEAISATGQRFDGALTAEDAATYIFSSRIAYKTIVGANVVDWSFYLVSTLTTITPRLV
jgi:hypothetical protein